jgi:hypothetical protein
LSSLVCGCQRFSSLVWDSLHAPADATARTQMGTKSATKIGGPVRGRARTRPPMANEIQAILYLRLSNPKDFRSCVLTLVCVRPSVLTLLCVRPIVLHCNFSVLLSACTNSNPSAE